ncbi:MAG: hypothetical protein ACRC92_23920 [Peptostreptococcaceae bacterium]
MNQRAIFMKWKNAKFVGLSKLPNDNSGIAEVRISGDVLLMLIRRCGELEIEERLSSNTLVSEFDTEFVYNVLSDFHLVPQKVGHKCNRERYIFDTDDNMTYRISKLG